MTRCYFCNDKVARTIKRGLYNKKIVYSCIPCNDVSTNGLDTYQETHPEFTDQKKNFSNYPNEYPYTGNNTYHTGRGGDSMKAEKKTEGGNYLKVKFVEQQEITELKLQVR